jgi:hypothetical protein
MREKERKKTSEKKGGDIRKGQEKGEKRKNKKGERTRKK